MGLNSPTAGRDEGRSIAVIGTSITQVRATHAGQNTAADDARLVAFVARGDAAAFRTIIDRHGPTLHRLAYRMLGDASEAEDVAQESLLRLWDGAAAWRPVGGGVPAWLRRVATNLCLDRIRRSARVTDGEPPDRVDDKPGADAAFDSCRVATAARNAVLSLPDRQRAAIVLTYYEETSNADAAAALGLKLKAFESLLVRARSSLRDHVRAAGITAADLPIADESIGGAG